MKGSDNMENLLAGCAACIAVGGFSALICIVGNLMKSEKIDQKLSAFDNRIQGKSARRSANRTSAKETTTISRYQFDRVFVSSNYHNQKKLSRR